MRIKLYITILLLVLAVYAIGQQQTLYTNYLMNQYLYNPAYSGVVDGTEFNAAYRHQWAGFDGSPKTFMINGYGKFKKKPNMSAGGLITTERIGLLQRTTFYATYGYHLKINKKAAINFGLGVGGIQHKVRVYDARPYDKDDAFLGADVLSAFAFDANAGFYFYTKNFFLGFSDQQMPNAKILWSNSTGRNSTHFYAYSGYNFHASKQWVIQPSILARTNAPAPYQLEYHLKVIYDEMFWVGFSFREKSSSCFLFGCKIDQKYSFAYSYDYTLSKMSKYSTGTHEIMLSYLLPFKKKKSKSDLIKDADEEELNKIDNTLRTNLRNKKKKESEKKANEQENKTEPEQGKTDVENKTETEKPQNTDVQAVPEQPQVEPGSNTETEKAPESVSPPETGVKQETEAKPETEVKKEPEPEQKNEVQTEPKH